MQYACSISGQYGGEFQHKVIPFHHDCMTGEREIESEPTVYCRCYDSSFFVLLDKIKILDFWVFHRVYSEWCNNVKTSKLCQIYRWKGLVEKSIKDGRLANGRYEQNFCSPCVIISQPEFTLDYVWSFF